MSKQIRYIRDYLSGNSVDGAGAGCHWAEIAAWDVGRTNSVVTDPLSNRALGAAVSANFVPVAGHPLSSVTDGVTTATPWAGQNGADLWVQVDLGATRQIEFVQVWHYYGDTRMYYRHRLDVSIDGANWVTVNPPEGAVKEAAGGASYYLMSAFQQESQVSLPDLVSIQSAINAARAKRNLTTYVFSAFGLPITASKVTEMKSSLAEATLAFTQSLTNNQGAIEKQDYDEVVANVYKYMGGAACASGCTMECRTSCDVACGAICSTGCANGCTGGCASACFDICHGGCSVACAIGCGAACANGCKSGCSGCTGSCGWACSGYINGGGNTCGCGNTCGGACGDACNQACFGTCVATCGAACQTGCGTTCNLYCGNGCSRGCGSACQVICSAACSNGCEATCTGTCAMTASASPTS